VSISNCTISGNRVGVATMTPEARGRSRRGFVRIEKSNVFGNDLDFGP
jgi:hypothetical protein